MGNQQKKTIDSNQNQQTTSQENIQFMKIIRQAFYNVSINGILTKDKFNQALAVLQGLGFKRLRDTPLADRLFILFDKQKVGHISESEFSTGISQIITDKNNAILYTFRAYDRDGDNQISKKQFIHFIEESWMAAFRILAEGIDEKNAGGLKIRDIELWSKSKISALNENSSKIFAKYDISNKGFIEFPAFKDFVSSSHINDIIAKFDDKGVLVPLNLTNLYANG